MRRIKYIYQNKNWPNFTWDYRLITPLLASFRLQQGILLGKMSSIGFTLKNQASYEIITQDVLKTSKIEGELLDTDSVRSSVGKRLGIKSTIVAQKNHQVDGVVDVLLDAINHRDKILTKNKLFTWHKVLFPLEINSVNKIQIGKWRTQSSGPMQVISGPYGKEQVHYEAPSYLYIEKEIELFLLWLKNENNLDLVLKSAIAHLWFITIHPFDDGNGRISRAISDMLLAKSEESPFRFYSLSSQIESERKSYYDILEKTQKGELDITLWLEWYLDALKKSIENSDSILTKVLFNNTFWNIHRNHSINDRQQRMLDILLDNFIGKLTTSKWAKMTKCSQDTALRDIIDLINKDILYKDSSGGRSTHYLLKELPNSK
ncbi:Fic family protein [bacterium]|jgi:Fic family protein|nr:Fic family protein [bacterium]